MIDAGLAERPGKGPAERIHPGHSSTDPDLCPGEMEDCHKDRMCNNIPKRSIGRIRSRASMELKLIAPRHQATIPRRQQPVGFRFFSTDQPLWVEPFRIDRKQKSAVAASVESKPCLSPAAGFCVACECGVACIDGITHAEGRCGHRSRLTPRYPVRYSRGRFACKIPVLWQIIQASGPSSQARSVSHAFDGKGGE